MSGIDLNHLRTWIGKSRAEDDLIIARHARLMAATVDIRQRNGSAMASACRLCGTGLLPRRIAAERPRLRWPPGARRVSTAGPLSNRMWADRRVSFLAPVPIGSTVRKESSILKVDYEQGRSGELVFVTVHTN